MKTDKDKIALFLAWPLVAPLLLFAVACALIIAWPLILTNRFDLS